MTDRVSDWISPYSWPEILRKFPLDYSRWVDIPRGQIPPGRLIRELDDKAAQYGDLLEHGNTYVLKPANVIFFSGCASSATSSYTMTGCTSSGSARISFPSDYATSS